MKTVSVTELKSHLSAYLKECEEGPVVVTRKGRAVAALIALEDEDDLERLVLAHSPKLKAILEAANQDVEEGKGLSHEEFWARVEAETK